MKWMKSQGHSRWNKKIEKYTYGLAMVAMVLFFIWLCSWVGLQRPSEIQAFSIRVHKILAKLKLKWASAFSRWPASNRGSDRRTVDIKVHHRPLQGYVFNAKKFPGAASKSRQSSFCLYVLLIVRWLTGIKPLVIFCCLFANFCVPPLNFNNSYYTTSDACIGYSYYWKLLLIPKRSYVFMQWF